MKQSVSENVKRDSTHSSIRLRAATGTDVSIIIVSYNTREKTLSCISSVLENSGQVSLEVIVVDNQSSDGSSEAIRAKFPEVLVVDSPKNGGFAYGNAIGFEQATGRYMLVLNPDTVLGSGVLAECCTWMDNNKEAGILGPKILNEDGTHQPSMIRFMTLRQCFFMIFLTGKHHSRLSSFGDPRYAAFDQNDEQRPDAIMGAFMFARRSMVDEIGGLDRRFFMYGEEVEWCWRARKSGWEIVYQPRIEIMHIGGASKFEDGKFAKVEMSRGHILFLSLTRGQPTARFATALMITRDIVRAPAYVGSCILNGFKWTSDGKLWLARLSFEVSALFNLPKGQDISLPDPENTERIAQE